MGQREEQASNTSWLRRWDSIRDSLRAVKSRLGPRTTSLDQEETGSVVASENGSALPSQQGQALRIAGYSLVLMDPDGQVVWTREWDSGGVFEFGPHQQLLVSCGFTNHTQSQAEISEYEIELMSEDGAVVERFGESFGDFLIIPPGASKEFPAEWRM
jgi:hypothetical protein